MDSALKNDRSVKGDHPRILFYNGNSAKVYGDGKGILKKEGFGFGEGDTVGLRVDMETGEVEWTVNGVRQVAYTMESVKDGRVKWVPMLRMYEKGDVVEWMVE